MKYKIEFDYNPQFTFNSEIAIEMEQWCKKNLGNYQILNTHEWLFETENDAIIFKLKYGGNIL
jgi:hypothetical protein